MKKNWVYIMTDSENRFFHVGYCADIVKAIKFYKELPMLPYVVKKVCEKTAIIENPKYNILIYLEENKTQGDSFERFKQLTEGTYEMKIDLIKTFNPGFVELTPGVNIEL